MIKIKNTYFVEPNELGGKNNPLSNEHDLFKAIKDRKNCCMYTKGTLLLSQSVLNELETKNIELFGENYLNFTKQLEKEILEENNKNDMIPTGILKDIVKDIKPTLSFRTTFDELHEKNIYVKGKNNLMKNKITINNINYRPCYIESKKALFHRWEDFAKPIPPSMLLGGDPGGQIWHTLGIVEMEDGSIKEVTPREIRFADNLIEEYAFDNEI